MEWTAFHPSCNDGKVKLTVWGIVVPSAVTLYEQDKYDAVGRVAGGPGIIQTTQANV